MLLIVFLSSLVFLVTGTAVESSAHTDDVVASSWRGIIEHDDGKLLVDLAFIRAENLQLTLGSVKSAEGDNMAFLVPTSGEGLISSTWTEFSLAQDVPVVLWSDGACVLAERRVGGAPAKTIELAPWLGWGIRPPDVVLLTLIYKTGRAGWAGNELFQGLNTAYPEATIEAEDFKAVVWQEVEPPGGDHPIPLQEHWDEIMLRFTETRNRLKRMGSVFEEEQ